MSTDDCSIAGQSSCPCGDGEIVVEYCIPDHGWVREQQGRYDAHLTCQVCRSKFDFFGESANQKPRLVLREDAEVIGDAAKNWHITLREIEASSGFKELSDRLAKRLGEQRSKAAEHRVLTAARLTHDSIGQFRNRAFRLSALNASALVDLFSYEDKQLAELISRAEKYYETSKTVPNAVSTGNAGLQF
ncbi:MAG: hypothetical protein ACOH2J_20820 [Allorhizobium sp.]